jgi:hypothetical protein
MPVYIFTSDKYLWALRVMLHLYQKYWGWPAIVFGFSKPEFELPKCARFESMGAFSDYPAGKWSDAVIKALQSNGDKYAVVLLEDYWLTRYVDEKAINLLGTYVMSHGDIARADLVTDRLYAPDLIEVEPYDDLDIISNDPPPSYHMSLQASIWNKAALLDALVEGESAWLAELNGTTRLINAGWRVIGTRQCPVRYVIGVQNGKLSLMGGYQVPAPKWKGEDLAAVVEMLKEDRQA